MSKDAPAAARSAAALAGFLVVVGLQLTVVLIGLWAVLWALPGGFALRIGVPLGLATFGALGYATWRALHIRHRVPAGVAVNRDQAPRLWEAIDAAAAAARVRTPDGLTIVADATAALGERTRLIGFIGGRRDLYLGMPLLQALEPGQLAAIIAHELGHGSPNLGRWAPLAYRGRITIGRIIPRIGRRNLAGAALRAYAGFYRRVDAPFSREQELAADRIAAAHAGPGAALTALRDLPALAGMQRLFHAEYVGPGWQAGYVPDDVFGGLLRVLAARTAEMTMLRAREPEPAGPWDTHPPMPERLAALAALAASGESPAPHPTPPPAPAAGSSS
ncbi:MAG TPA: M48 family metallopeptidase, partial [Actinoplanes sp.]|nr:M48 family metallopeptidase [Actinoplanes sp.]